MQSKDTQAEARRHLDNRLSKTAIFNTFQRPPRGWVRAVREALGMTTVQLARRLGVSQPAVVLLEQSEALGHIKLETLQRAAAALDCRLVYTLVPDQPLEHRVQSRRRELAERHLASVEHSMALENQSVENQSAEDQKTREQLLRVLSEQIDPKTLWSEQ